MSLKLRKIVKMLDDSGYDAYYNESDDPTVEDDEVIITGSKFSLSVDSNGGYYAVLSEEHSNGNGIYAMTDHGTAESMPQLRKLLTKAGFSLKK